MVKYFKVIFAFLISVILFAAVPVNAQDRPILQATITKVPDVFWGTWRVASYRKDTDSPDKFKENGVDLWNLSRDGDVIILYNLFNGAKAEVIIDKVEDTCIVFTKSGKYSNKYLTDTVKIELKGDKFTGEDYLKLDTISEGKVVKTSSATYEIVGEKIAGQNIIKTGSEGE